jgi:hypothetical protein
LVFDLLHCCCCCCWNIGGCCCLAGIVVGWVCVIKKSNSFDGDLFVDGKRLVEVSNDENGSKVIEDDDGVEVGQREGCTLDN